MKRLTIILLACMSTLCFSVPVAVSQVQIAKGIVKGTAKGVTAKPVSSQVFRGKITGAKPITPGGLRPITGGARGGIPYLIFPNQKTPDSLRDKHKTIGNSVSLIERHKRIIRPFRIPEIPPVPTIKDTSIVLGVMEKYAQYLGLRKKIENGECDDKPGCLLWAANYALSLADTTFFESCFEKALSPHLTVDVLQPFIQGGLGRCRDKIPALLQYMAERDVLSLADSTVYVPDSVRQATSRTMTEWAANYYPELQPIIAFYSVGRIQYPTLGTMLYKALSVYTDSVVNYSDATVGLLLDSYLENARLLPCDGMYYSDPDIDDVTKCFVMCRHPRLQPFVESDIHRVFLLADLAAINASEDKFYHYRDLALSLCPEDSESIRRELSLSAGNGFGTSNDKGGETDRVRFRMITTTSDDPMSAAEVLFASTYGRIMSNIWGYSHMPFMKYIKDCRRCRRRMEAILATLDDMLKIDSSWADRYADRLLLERTRHYFNYILDPAQSQHIGEMEKILDKIKDSDIDEKDQFIVETAVILADMRSNTDDNLALAIKGMKPYRKLADRDNLSLFSRKYYYECLAMLYDLAGDEKNAAKVAKKLMKIDKAIEEECEDQNPYNDAVTTM